MISDESTVYDQIGASKHHQDEGVRNRAALRAIAYALLLLADAVRSIGRAA